MITTTGKAPFSGFSKAKASLDEIMLKELRRRAEERGQDRETVKVPNWRLHDLRRTARSLIARAGVRPDHAERVLGHVIRGVEGTYDRQLYEDEKRAALRDLATLVLQIAAGKAPSTEPPAVRLHHIMLVATPAANQT